MSFTGVREVYYKAGELRTSWFECNGVRDGEYKSFWPNGELHSICNYINNKREGKYKYYDQEYLKEEGYYKDDKRNGIRIEYFQNGNICCKFYFLLIKL